MEGAGLARILANAYLPSCKKNPLEATTPFLPFSHSMRLEVGFFLLLDPMQQKRHRQLQRGGCGYSGARHKKEWRERERRGSNCRGRKKSEQTVGEEGGGQQQRGKEGEDGKNLPKAMMLSPSSSLDHLVFCGDGRRERKRGGAEIPGKFCPLSSSLSPLPLLLLAHIAVFSGACLT